MKTALDSLNFYLDPEGAPGGEAAAPEESVSTYDRAMDYAKEHPLFEDAPEEPAKPAEAPPAEPVKPAEAAKPGEAPPAEAPKPGEPAKPADGYDPTKALADPKDFEKLPYFKDATFQKLMGEHKDLSQQINNLSEIFGGNWRENGTKYAINDTAQLKGVLEDAFSLYDIGNLNLPVTEFMEVFEKNFPEANVRAVLASLSAYAEGKGIKATESADLNNPTAVRLNKIEQERKTEREAKARENDEGEKRKAFEALETHVTEFVKGHDADVADATDYLTVVVSQIGGKAEFLKAIREGKFAQVDKMLTEYHNKQVERQDRWLKAKVEKANTREDKLKNQPKPGQGAPPSAPAAPKVNLADGEQRRAEALRQFQNPTR